MIPRRIYSEIATNSNRTLIVIRDDELIIRSKVSFHSMDYQDGIELIDLLYDEFNKIHERTKGGV